MTHKEFQQLVETYGADWHRWPESRRSEAQALLAISAEACSAQNEEGKLDELLDHLQPEPAGQWLKASLRKRAATLPQHASTLPSEVRSRWKGAHLARAAMFAGLFLLGVVLGSNESSLAPAHKDDGDLTSVLRESLFAEEWIP
jgi:hypothetical protein